MNSLKALCRRTLSPVPAFTNLAETQPPMGRSLGEMLLWRVPVALLDSGLMYLAVGLHYDLLRRGEGPMSELLRRLTGGMSEDLIQVIRDLQPLPSWKLVFPWLLLAAPLGILSAWLHHAVWDHTCLWLLGGLKAKRGFRTSLIAEAEALKVGVLGAALGLLGNLPMVGPFLSLPLLLVGLYFWVLRGVALAAFHGCETWKGITATLLHGFLLLACFSGLLLGFALLLAQALT